MKERTKLGHRPFARLPKAKYFIGDSSFGLDFGARNLPVIFSRRIRSPFSYEVPFNAGAQEEQTLQRVKFAQIASFSHGL